MENPNFHLDSVIKEKDELVDFEGPLSVILMLLAKNKIEIRDIQISLILDQYLDYLEEMKQMDLEIASEFVQMASHLMYIKTKMLLTGEKEAPSELEELIASLEKLKCRDLYTSIQEVVPQFKKMSECGMLYFVKPQEIIQRPTGQYEYKHKPVELLSALNSMLVRVGSAKDFSLLESAMPKRIIYSIKTKSVELLERLQKKNSRFSEIIADCGSKSEMIAAFASILELCSRGNIHIEFLENDFELSYIQGVSEDLTDYYNEEE